MKRRVSRLPVALLSASLAGTAVAAPASDLLSMQLEDLMQIAVVGASKYPQAQGEVAAAVSVITRQEIRAHGWRTLGEALSSLPGFTATNDRQYTFPTFRGIGLPGDYATRLLVTINGNRLNDPLFDQGTFGRMLPVDLDLIERIEFIPGPGGAVFGQNAMFGVVNLVTRNGTDLEGVEGAVSGQQPERMREGRLSWGGTAGDTELLFSATLLDADGKDRPYDFGPAGVAGVPRGFDYERDRELFARARRGALTLDAFHGSRIKGDPTANFFTDPLVPGKRNRDSYTQGQVTLQQSLTASLDLAGRLFVGRYDTDSRATAGGVPLATSGAARWYGTDAQLLFSGVQGHKLMLGAEVQVESRRDQGFYDPNAPGPLLLHADGTRTSLYAQDEWRIAGPLAATLGVRLDHEADTGTQVSPRAGLRWQVSPSASLKALYGRAHRGPNGFERDYGDGVAAVPNPGLDGERVDTTELVLDLRLTDPVALRLAAYRWKLSDLITQGVDPVSGLAQYQSGAPLHADGLEVSGDHTWSGGARLRVSATFQQTADADDRRLVNSPAWLGKASFTQPMPWAGLNAGALWRYDSARRTLAGARLGGFGVFDLTLGAETRVTGLSVRAALTNLFDRRYALPASGTNWQDTLDQDGRSLLVTAGYRY